MAAIKPPWNWRQNIRLPPYWLVAVWPLDFNHIFHPNKGGRNLIANSWVPLKYRGCAPITPAQTLAPNDITRTRWPRPCLGCLGFSFVRWEEVKPWWPTLSGLEFFHQSTCCSVLQRHHQAEFQVPFLLSGLLLIFINIPNVVLVFTETFVLFHYFISKCFC